MLPNIIIVCGSLLFISVAKGLKDCSDCVIITNCEHAREEVILRKNEDTIRILKATFCGYENSLPKVCCNDFFLSLIGVRSSIYEENEVNTGDEIETHPNIKLLSDECGDVEGNRIMGGTTATLFEFPWLVLVQHKILEQKIFNCGGTLINSRYVLTAAHCIKGHVVTSVRIGEYDISTEVDCTGHGENRDCISNYQDIDVDESIYHHGYTRFPVQINDIGLLRLGKPANLTYRNSGIICLPVTKTLRQMDIYGERAVVAGWGITENRRKSNVLLKVEVPIYSPETCTTYYNGNQRRREIFKEMRNTMCAGELGRDSCKGDSGGPLMLEGPYNDTYKFIQFGIVSYGYSSQCGNHIPGVYTDVRNFMKWILDTIKP